MAKEIVLTDSARTSMLKGIDVLARAVEITYGARGSAVVIQHRTDGIAPIYTRDGVTVAKAIEFRDRLEDIGARMLRDVASATSRESGDGTTTAVVLARAIAREAARLLAIGANPVLLRRGMEKAAGMVISELQQRALPADIRCLRSVCACASKEQHKVADYLMEAMLHVGPEGKVSVEMGHLLEDDLDLSEGVSYEQGYLSPYFNTDKERGIAELDHPYILFYDREVSDFMEIVPLLEEVNESGRSLLIMAEGFEEKALTPLLLNHVRGNFRAVAVKPPGYGDKRLDRLKDLALLTGGKACLESEGGILERVQLSDLGQCQKAIITADSTTLIGTQSESVQVKALIEGLEMEMSVVHQRKPGLTSATANQHELEELEERVGHLRGKSAVYRVGGSSDLEIRERLIRIENASSSMRAAMTGGVVPGGGLALYHAMATLQTSDCTGDESLGVSVVRQALKEPLRRIVLNAGENPEVVMAQIMMQDDSAYGYDAETNAMGNLLDLGVIDPVTVTISALRNAVHIIGTVINTEVIIYEPPLMEQFPNSQAIAEWAAATREDPRAA